ncbi:MAG: hypothetical protein HKN29_16720 [Rhodothermales bacterium]|nr:hypothetical protein [Rhodothermales bacterium]
MTLTEPTADVRKLLMAFCAGVAVISLLRVGLSIAGRVDPAGIDLAGIAVSLVALGLLTVGQNVISRRG